MLRSWQIYIGTVKKMFTNIGMTNFHGQNRISMDCRFVMYLVQYMY